MSVRPKWFMQRGPTDWFPVHAVELRLWPSYEHREIDFYELTDDELGEICERLEWRLARCREDLEAGRTAYFNAQELEGITEFIRGYLADDRRGGNESVG